jgi:threonyl-tRNA synthetase
VGPQQVVVMNITDKQSEYVQKVVKTLQNNGIRATSDLRNEKIGFKIREHTLKRVPYMLVVGDQEMADNAVAVRTRRGVDQGKMATNDFITQIVQDIADKKID